MYLKDVFYISSSNFHYRKGFNPPWARGCIPNKGRPITGSKNPGPTEPKPVISNYGRLSVILGFITIFASLDAFIWSYGTVMRVPEFTHMEGNMRSTLTCNV